MISYFLFSTFLVSKIVHAQINLGTLNFNRNPAGDLEFDFGQAANIFGFGGDRQLGVTLGPGKFDTKVDGGALIGGERLGLDGQLGVRENQALNLGSNIKFGNGPPNPNDPAGQLNSFINNVGYFFQRFMPPPVQPSQGPGLVPGPIPRGPRQRPVDPLNPEPTLVPDGTNGPNPFEEEFIYTSTDRSFGGVDEFGEEGENGSRKGGRVTTEGRFSTDSQDPNEFEKLVTRNRPRTPEGLIEFKMKPRELLNSN